MNVQILIMLAISSLVIISCKSANVEYKYPKSKEEREYAEMGSVVTGDDQSIQLFGGKPQVSAMNKTVNIYLWQAALDVLSFMPIASVDSAGGTIITDWYMDKKTPNEKFKFVIMVTSTNLDAISLKVQGFKRVKLKNGEWQDTKMKDALVKDIENKILTKALQIRMSNL